MTSHLENKQLQYPNISRRKDNQTMKFSQLKEHNMSKVYVTATGFGI